MYKVSDGFVDFSHLLFETWPNFFFLVIKKQTIPFFFEEKKLWNKI